MTIDCNRPQSIPKDHHSLQAGTVKIVDDPRAYRRIAAQVRQQIEDGTLSPGQPVPSITTLSQLHGVSRETAAKALRLLESEHLVQRFPGLGYYVAEAEPR